MKTPLAYLVILLACLGISCQKSKLQEPQPPSSKDANSLEACEQLNIMRDAAWTASFVRSFVACASTKKDSTDGSLTRTLALIDRLGLERLQMAMDLLLLKPGKLELAASTPYPNLRALITLIDRGVHDEQGETLAGTEQRWDKLQTIFMDLEPKPLVRLLIELEKAGTLDAMIVELIAWSDQLPPATLAGLSHQVLNDPKMRQDLLLIEASTLNDPSFRERLRRLWQPRAYPWAPDPKAQGETLSFFAHTERFWKQLAAEQQQRFAHALAAALRVTLDTPADEVLRRTLDVYELVRSFALRQGKFLSELRILITAALQTSREDLAPAIQGIQQIKDNPSYRDAFEEKVGSTYLHQLLEDFLWDGGTLQSCQKNVPGLKTLGENKDPRAILQAMLSPDTDCQGRLPLLLYLDETLGLNCRTGSCAKTWLPAETEISQQDFAQLSRYAWDWLEKELASDPYRLKNRQLAYGAIESTHLSQLKTLWLSYLPKNVEELLALDRKINQDPLLQGILKKDFAESWYNIILQKLNSLSFEFYDLWPDRNNPEAWLQRDIDTKLQRAGLGLYALGPLDQAFARAAPIRQTYRALSHELTQAISEDQWSQILSPLREISAQVKQGPISIKPETERTSFQWPGSISQHIAYNPKGEMVREPQGFSARSLVRESSEGWMILSRYRDQLPLLTATAQPSQAKALEQRIVTQYFDAWTLDILKSLQEDPQAVPTELFQGDSLSPEEIRLFSLFAAQAWLGVRPSLPQGSEVAAEPSTPVFAKDLAPQVFLGIPVLAGSQQMWSGLWAFRSFFFANSANSLGSLLQALPQDESKVRQELLQNAQNPQIISQGRLNVSDRDKLSPIQTLMLSLQSVSSVYKARGQQIIVPSMGFDRQCPKGQTLSSCPFTVADFASWRQFLEQRVLQHFCPFISGPNFSADFQVLWQDALGFGHDRQELETLCSSHHKLRANDLPFKLWEQNFLTLLKLGRNPQLKPGLLQIPERLRRLKVEGTIGDYQRFARYLEMNPIWIPISSSRLLHREGVYTAFRWRSPGLIDHILAAYNHEIGDKAFTDALKNLGRSSKDGINPVSQLMSVITETYSQKASEDETALQYLLRVAERICQDPKLIETTGRLLEKPEDPFAGILLAYTFPQAIKVGVFENFAWDHPNYRLMRELFKSENRRLMLGFFAAFDRLSPKLWQMYQDAASAYPNSKVMAKDLTIILDFSQGLLASADGDGILSRLWQDMLTPRWSDSLFAAGVHILQQLREPWLDLSNEWHDPLRLSLDPLVQSSINFFLKSMLMLERLPAGKGLDQALAAYQGLSKGLLSQDGHELWRLLQDKRLGLTGSSSLTEQLRDDKTRKNLRELLVALWDLDAQSILSAIDEWESAARSSQKFFAYLEENIQWRGSAAASFRYGMAVLGRQLEDQQRRLNEQWGLLRHWLSTKEAT